MTTPNQINVCSVSSPSDPSKIIPLLRKSKAWSVERDTCGWKLYSALFSFMTSDKIWLFLILYECLQALHISSYGPYWLSGIVITLGLNLTIKFRILIWSERSEWNYRAAVPTLFESSVLFSDWHPHIRKSSNWNFQLYSMLFPNFWWS